MDIRELKVGDPVARIYGGRWSSVRGVEFGAVVKVTKTRVTAKFGDGERVYSMRNRPWGEASAGGWISHSTDHLATIEVGRSVSAVMKQQNSIKQRIELAGLGDLWPDVKSVFINREAVEDTRLQDLAQKLRVAADILEGKE